MNFKLGNEMGKVNQRDTSVCSCQDCKLRCNRLGLGLGMGSFENIKTVLTRFENVHSRVCISAERHCKFGPWRGKLKTQTAYSI